MRRKGRFIFLATLFLIGLGLLLYPCFSDHMAKKEREKTIWSYEDAASKKSLEETSSIKEQARLFNASIPRTKGLCAYNEEQSALYPSELNLRGDGVMGILSVPSVGINLPIYHSTDEGVLRIGVGHVEGSSLPAGGPDTHAVLSSHTGMAGARLFTDLDKVREGDVFTISVLGEKLCYEVYRIETVLPDETDSLGIEPGEDLVTLVTCTPYGVNSHRLLVHGKRTQQEPVASPGKEKPDAFSLALAFLALLFSVLVLILRRINRGRRAQRSK